MKPAACSSAPTQVRRHPAVFAHRRSTAPLPRQRQRAKCWSFPKSSLRRRSQMPQRFPAASCNRSPTAPTSGAIKWAWPRASASSRRNSPPPPPAPRRPPPPGPAGAGARVPGAGGVGSFGRAECDADALTASLGRDWAVMRVTFKPYPVCAFNQTPVTAALTLREKLANSPIKAVRVRMNPYETGYAGMDAVGPFNSVSGTLMSIPFCIAATLLYGVPDMRRMLTYDDAAVNKLISSIKLISDDAVPTLCCKIEAETADGRTLVQDQRMTFADYSFDRAGVSALIRRIGREQAVPEAAYDRLETFVAGLPNGSIADLLQAFALLPRATPPPP